MAKKRKPKTGATSAAGTIDLAAVLETIRPHLEGMTQHKIAEVGGISQPAVAQVLSGSRTPSLSVLSALAKASGGSIELKFRKPLR